MWNKKGTYAPISAILSTKFVMFFSFWGLRPQTPTGALPLDPAGGLLSPRPPHTWDPPFSYF